MLSPRGFKRARLELIYLITGERAPTRSIATKSFYVADASEGLPFVMLSYLSKSLVVPWGEFCDII